MYGWKSLMNVFASAALVAAFAFAAPVFAQDGSGGDVEDVSVQTPSELTGEGGGDPDFGAALEAAAAAEGRPSEHVPKNEITVIKKTDTASASKAEKRKREKKPKAEDSGEKLGNTMGARLGVGSDIDLSLGFGIGVSSAYRIGLGINMGWGTADGYNFTTYEGFGFWDWNFNISDDGALRWFVGPGATFGVYGAEADTKPVKYRDKSPKTEHRNDSVFVTYTDTVKFERDSKISSAFSIGVGARTGLEVDLSFIDPDHALSMLRSSSVSLDVRLLLYLFLGEEQKNYPAIMPSLGVTYNYVFGGGKSKEKK
jgi:hypothetical protein